ncbi:MAG: hypothetical protein JNL18_18205 [Planctomycetaceae bacterium]|nr:hypothetical protein [Planctomycetaceae bacterium]
MAKELMLRRIATALLMMVYVAGQLAMVPHLHAQNTAGATPGHAERPHIHLGHAHHEHDHQHGASHHGHSHHSRVVCTDLAAIASGDHDQDALYFPDEVGPSTAAKIGNSAASVDAELLLSIDTLATTPQPLQALAASIDSNEYRPTPRPLYLTLRALRI